MDAEQREEDNVLVYAAGFQTLLSDVGKALPLIEK